jgi:hypothetical protein
MRSSKRQAQCLKYQPFRLCEIKNEPCIQEHPSFRAKHSTRDFEQTGSTTKSASATNPQSASSGLTLTIAKPTETRANDDKQAFENTSTSVAASQMRNALNNLADTVTDSEDKKVRLNDNEEFGHTLILYGSFSRPRWTTSLLSSEDT